jgi:hypothetical protein
MEVARTLGPERGGLPDVGNVAGRTASWGHIY